MKLQETLSAIARIDQLIRLKATGTPRELAERLSISERSARRIISTMRDMGAPISYCYLRQSYCYDEMVFFKFGFFHKKVETERVYGGRKRLSNIFRGLWTNGQNLTAD